MEKLKIIPPDAQIYAQVKASWDKIAKPLDGLGQFETMFAQIGAITGSSSLSIEKKVILTMCADNGVVAEGVSQSGQEVTAVVAGFMGQQASSVGKMARRAGVDVIPVDIGINTKETLPGVRCQQVTRPIASVGLYIPGGSAPLFSTVLMLATPARIAGCQQVVLCSPPPIADEILYAAQLCGVKTIFNVGGAQAIAALAYGTESIAPVAKITGPGNAYVAAAKKVVSGDVGIDMIAGPSEVCVLADETALPELVAVDLMAQAEHDPLASCYLVTFSEAYADAVENAIKKTVESSTRKEITMSSLTDKGLIVICDSLAQALQTINVIAPEHLELHVSRPMELLGQIRNAGAIFMGEWTPEAVGDYVAGPNHTLPTGGTARYASPLSVDEFVKKSSVIQYSAAALKNDARAIETIADHEGLWAHAQSVRLRMELMEQGRVPANASSTDTSAEQAKD